MKSIICVGEKLAMLVKRYKKAAIIAFILLFIFNYSAIGAALKEKDKKEILNKVYTLQIPFIENKGQIKGESVRYYAKTFGGTVFVTQKGRLIYNLPAEKGGVALREIFIGSKAKTVKGEKKAITKVNYFLGKDRKKWLTDLSTYKYVSLGELWKGIRVKVSAYGKNVEKLFYIEPGAKAKDIKVRIEGAKGLELAEDGRLKVITEKGDIYFTKPFAYQEIDGKRKQIKVAYVIKGNEYTFKLGEYDQTRPVVIDPLLASTYLGGKDFDYASALAIDHEGNVYVAGRTGSSDYPTTNGAYDKDYNGYGDAFISKLNSDLSELLVSTYLGGEKHGDSASALAIDHEGNVYVAGDTDSSDFPTTPGAYDKDYNGYGDAFISKLNSDLSNLLASTYLGGEDGEGASALAIDQSGNVYVAGDTGASDFPTTPGAYDKDYNGYGDAFISKLNSDLSNLLASTYLGGEDSETTSALAIDQEGNVYVAGYTGSSYFPTTPSAYDKSYNGRYYDAFISKLSSDLSNLLASTYLGGGGREWASALAIDQEGNVYLAGYTYSSDYPTTSGAYNESLNGYCDVFVSKLDSNLSSEMEVLNISVSDSPDPFNPLYETNTITITNETNTICSELTLSIEGIGRIWEWENLAPSESIQATWDGRDNEGNIVPTGTYAYQVAISGQMVEIGTITVLSSEEKTWSKEIVDLRGDAPKGYDIVKVSLLHDGDDVLAALTPEAFYADHVFGAKIELAGPLAAQPYSGVGMRIVANDTVYLLAYCNTPDYQGAYLFVSYDGGQSWQEAEGNYSGYIYSTHGITDEKTILLAINMEDIGSLPWTVDFLSGIVYTPAEYEIKDQTEPLEVVPENRRPTITSISQYQSDGTQIPEGGIIPEGTVVFKATLEDPDGDDVRFEIELREIDEPFTGEPTSETISDFVPSGSEVTITRSGLVDGEYHWQYRVKDSKGAVSGWKEFGEAGNVDFKVESLLAKYAPVLYLHPDEEFYPWGIYSMLDQCDLRNEETISNPRPENLADHNSEEYYLDLRNAKPYLNVPDAGRWATYTPIVYGRKWEDSFLNKKVLQYWFFYPFNDWKNDHEGDWEMIQIILDEKNNPEAMCCARHHGGGSYAWNRLYLIKNTHPKVFVGKGSHSSWASLDAGVLSHVEELSDKGIVLYPKDILETSDIESDVRDRVFYELIDVSSEPDWIKWLGKWGETIKILGAIYNGPESPAQHTQQWHNPITWCQNLGLETVPASSFYLCHANSTPPVILHAYDSFGNHVGFTKTGEIEINIPGTYFYVPSSLSDDGQEYMWIYTEGNLIFEVHGGSEGAFNFEIRRYIKSSDTTVIVKYENIAFESNTCATVDTNPENVNFLMDVDFDGDGRVDYQVKPVSVEGIIGDLDNDGDIDRNDLNVILSYRNQEASACPECDLDGDGVITVLDARKLVLMCTRPRCAIE